MRGSGTVGQAGQIHGDARMGDIDNSRRTTVSLGTFGVVVGVVVSVVLGVATTLTVGISMWKFVATDGPPVTESTPSRTKSPPDGVRTKEIRPTRGTGADVDGTDTPVVAADGKQLCFATSDNQIGWLRVKSSTLPSFEASGSVVLAARVWPRL